MAGLQGLTGLAPSVIEDPGATPQERAGGPANPAHGDYTWDQQPRLPWQAFPGLDGSEGAAPLPDAVSDVPGSLDAGEDPYAFLSPLATGSHGAPWPSFGVADGDPHDAQQAAVRQSMNQDIHAAGDPGAIGRIARQLPANQQMELAAEADYVSSGDSLLQPVPNQLRGQFGRDRIQGFAPLNSYGFDSAHVRRPRYSGTIPGNFAWLTGSQRPMVVQHAGRQTWPVGDGSPFEGQDPGTGSVEGAALDGLPPAYSAPPVPPSGPELQAAYSPDYGW